MANLKSIIGVGEIKICHLLLQQLFAEFLGTFVYLSISLLADVESLSVKSGLGIGLLAASVVQIIGNVSGGHINPAVTLGALVCGQINFLRALCYIAVQIVAGIAGAAASYAMMPENQQSKLGDIKPYGIGSIFALELLLTSILVGVAISVTDPTRGAKGLGSAALAIGLSISAGMCLCSFYSVSMNPVRMLSSAVVAKMTAGSGASTDWARVSVYFVAPLVGGVLTGLVYRFVLNWRVRENYDVDSSSEST